MWLVFVGIWCYSRRWVWTFKALAQFKGSEGSPGLFQDFEHGYIKVEDFSSYSQGDPNSKSMDSQFSIVIF